MAIFCRRFPGSLTAVSLVVGFLILSSCTPSTADPAVTVEPATASVLLPVTVTSITETEVFSTAEIPETTSIPGASKTPTAPTVTAVAVAGATTLPETPALIGEAGFTVSGFVLGGGDTTPSGLSDAPRTFIYEVQQEDGSIVQVSYTAYPPSPVGDQQVITLNFFAGSIRAGDYLIARGTYEASTSTLTVIGEGDYIETYLEKS